MQAPVDILPDALLGQDVLVGFQVAPQGLSDQFLQVVGPALIDPNLCLQPQAVGHFGLNQLRHTALLSVKTNTSRPQFLPNSSLLMKRERYQALCQQAERRVFAADVMCATKLAENSLLSSESEHHRI
jgi:hypothetical protein